MWGINNLHARLIFFFYFIVILLNVNLLAFFEIRLSIFS
jgi:hypothetical protein